MSPKNNKRKIYWIDEGRRPAPIRLREGDELQELAEMLNRTLDIKPEIQDEASTGEAEGPSPRMVNTADSVF